MRIAAVARMDAVDRQAVDLDAGSVVHLAGLGDRTKRDVLCARVRVAVSGRYVVGSAASECAEQQHEIHCTQQLSCHDLPSLRSRNGRF
jgi:hypothetical protein